MPTYLIHGFRWHRASIRIHIILQDLEDAAAEWIVATATSNTLLNSFYTLYDFLPPSNPPPAVYPPPIPDEEPVIKERVEPPRALTKKNTKSMASLRSLGKKQKPADLDVPPLPKGKGHEARKASVMTTGSDTRYTPSRASANTNPYSMAKSETSETSEKVLSFNDWSVIKLLEQYDPTDMHSVSQPYAYVADYMTEVKLGASLTEEIGNYEARQRAEEVMSIPGTPGTPGLGITGDIGSPSMSARDIRRKSRRLGWFEKLRDGLQKGEEIGWFVVVCGDEERASPSMEASRERSSEGSDDTPQRTPRSSGFKSLFGKKKNLQEG